MQKFFSRVLFAFLFEGTVEKHSIAMKKPPSIRPNIHTYAYHFQESAILQVKSGYAVLLILHTALLLMYLTNTEYYIFLLSNVNTLLLDQ